MKRLISILLCVLMVVSVAAVGITVTHADTELDPNYLYFDTNGSGFELSGTDKVGFYVFPLSEDVDPAYSGWGGKKLQGKKVDGTDTLWYYDPVNFKLEDGKQYKIIFTHNRKNSPIAQTYDLIFDTSCLGHVAYCDGTTYENPVDSSKSTVAAFWRGKDAKEFGPVLQVSSIGNVLGTCPEEGKTPETIFVEFVAKYNEKFSGTGLENARKNVVDVGTKTEQKLIDDIGTDLGLSKDDVQNALTDRELIEDVLRNHCGYDLTKQSDLDLIQQALDAIPDTGVVTTWSYDDSTLPAGTTPTEAPPTEAPPTEAPHVHTPGEPTEENVVPATCKQAGSYDRVVYCTTCGEELSREHQVIGKLLHTPGEPVQENFVPATCKQAGGYDMVTYCTECGDEIEREHVDIGKLLHTPGEPVQENFVPATCKQAGGYDLVTYCTACGDEIEREHVDIGKLLHTPGEPVKENEKPATCTEKGGYDMVTYCTECGDQLSSEHFDTDMAPHTIIHKDEVPATATENGMMEHYECEICGALFFDEEGKQPATAEELIIPAEHVRGDANGDGYLDIDDATTIQRFCAELPVTDNWDEIAADADKDGIVDMVDVTLIQRVLAEMITFEEWDQMHAKG